MYVVDRIEENIVILENKENKKIMEINKDEFPQNIKEGDIIEIINNEYKINKKETEIKKNNIKDRFNKLKNK